MKKNSVLVAFMFLAITLVVFSYRHLVAGFLYKRGIDCGRKSEYDNAIQDFTKAIELNSKHENAYYNRGIVYGKKREYEKAIRDYTKVIELKPSFAEAYSNGSAT